MENKTNKELRFILIRQGYDCGNLKKSQMIKILESNDKKRNEFAGKALTGLLSNTVYFNPNEKHKMILEREIFKRAFSMADGMIKASKNFDI